MESTRAVRIPAVRRDAERTPIVGTERASPAWDNQSGRQRAVRTYGLFLAALLAIYGIFLGSFLTAPETGVRSNLSGYGLFSLLLVAIGLIGFVLTVWRAPREIRASDSEIVVRERSGRERRFPRGPGFVVSVLKRYPEGPFSEGPTEMVRVSLPDGTARIYLVNEGLIPAATPA
jgi:hypothetical protein